MAETELADFKKTEVPQDEAGDHEEAGGHGHHVNVSEIEPFRIHKWMEERPISWCCLLLWAYLSMWIILIPLMVNLGQDMIYLTTTVPMYMRNHQTRKNQDALKAAWEEADFQLASEVGFARQETQASVNLKLLFIAKASERNGFGLLKENIMTKINEISQRIINSSDYENYCQRVYETSGNDTTPYKCRRHFSVTQFYDPSFFTGALDQSYDVYPSSDNTINFVVPSKAFDNTAVVNDFDFSDENIENITNYWARYGEGTIPDDATYGNGVYNGEEMPSTFYFTSLDGSENQSLSNVFEALVDSRFGETPYDTLARAVLVQFYFGIPLEGYSSDSDRVDKQEEDIAEWAYDTLNEYFWEVSEKSKYTKHFTMRWDLGNMDDFYLNDQLISDMLLLLATITCVWLYTVFSVRSFWLGTMAMVMIFLNFAPALLLYRGISQIKYFGTLNMLSIFIILSIGADDVFVLCDAWEQTRAEAPTEGRPKRMTATLNHAGKVMFTTSISTIFSFLGNTTSVFPAVYTFGAFAAWLVMVNYFGVILFYPSVLYVHELYFFTPGAKYPWCIPVFCVERGQPACCLENMHKEDEEIQRKTTIATLKKSASVRLQTGMTSVDMLEDDEREALETEEDRRPIDLWFENKLFTVIQRFKREIIFVFMVFFLVCLGFAAQLVPDPNPPQFFPDGNNYYEFDYSLLDYFGSADNLRVNSRFVFGVKKVSRKNTDEAIADDIGKPVWDNDFAIAPPENQQWIAQFCDDLICETQEGYECRYPDKMSSLHILYSEDGRGLDVMRCFMTEFRYWVETSENAVLNSSDVQNILEDNEIDFWEEDDFVNCTWGTFPVEGGDTYQCFQILFGYVWIREELPTSNPDYQPGKSNYDYWKDYIGAEPVGGPTIADATMRFFVVELELDAYSTTDYRDGINLWEAWEGYFLDNWKEGADGETSEGRGDVQFLDYTPVGLTYGFMTDSGGLFSYYFLQRQIIYESISGIGLSISLAFCVLVAATGNWVIAVLAISVITMLVICIIGFTVMQGYKLGVMEAIIFVMVVGMVVDYVVHCSEAYLAAPSKDRVGRARGMLGLVGASVLSGSLSTVVGVFWMMFAIIPFFFKFGSSILFQEATSLTFALIFYPALLSAAGPQEMEGDVRRDYARVKAWCMLQYAVYYLGQSPPEPEKMEDADSSKVDATEEPTEEKTVASASDAAEEAPVKSTSELGAQQDAEGGAEGAAEASTGEVVA